MEPTTQQPAMTNSSLHDIAKFTYEQRVRRIASQRREATQDAIMPLGIMVVMGYFVGGVLMMFMMMGVVAVILCSPKDSPSPVDPLAFDDTEVPSFDMHAQDVAHRLMFMTR